MKPTETVYVNERVVACDGGKLGHPRVYLNMGEKNEVVCPYCSRRFVLKQPAAEAASP